jgi:MYXO-CTERM domain-containing protein
MSEQNRANSPKTLDNFARGLLATTCLTAACGSTALAGTVNLPNSDFGNTTPGVLLPTGTTLVNAFVGELASEQGFLNPEWFEFQGLTPGATYNLSAVYSPFGPRGESGNGETGVRMNVFTNSQTPLFTNLSLEGPGLQAAVSGLVPSDGFLDIEITGNRGSNTELAARGSFYQVGLSVEGSTTPEPATFAQMGAGLAVAAGALAWRRKRT